jgi:pyruvate,water dikinase
MEHALRESQSFGMSFIRGNCTAISINVYKIIENMNEIAPNRYKLLYDSFNKIENRLNRVLKERKKFVRGELVLPLKTVNKEMADQVGSKMANLGEIMNRVGLPVPEGFMITASAYYLFMEHNNLQEEINRRIQPLDLDDMEMLHRASADVQQLIIKSLLPDELEEAILSAYSRLEEKTEKGINVSLRSSALGEDMENASFAGQYSSRLNISKKFLSHSYKEILASKYSPQAITYRLNMGFRDEDIAMCVGCMAMVEAISSGVMYSRDPGNIRNNLKREIHSKDQKFVCFPEEGVCRMALVGDEKDDPSITNDQALFLSGLAARLEDHYGCPQDIEWSIDKNGIVKILQSRPLRQLDSESIVIKEVFDIEAEQPIILKGGVTASPGVASGPAFLVNTTVDVLRFPSDAILIAQHALPRWASLLSRAAAVVTDRGGVAGHLATVSREFNLPALFTVDADGKKVYKGRVESLLKEATIKRKSIMKGSPVYNTLEKVLEHIAPLNLTDPDAKNFRPEECRTYHDITRFCHEKAVKEMFNFGKDHHFSERSSKQLVCEVPMRWWVIDLEDGYKEQIDSETVKLENIASIPMLALWKGIIAVPWKGPPPVDTKGLASIMLRSTMDPSLGLTRRSRYGERNYFLISKHFCNLTSHFGYHFSTIETFLTERPKENYVSLNFKGGGADYNRRVGRVIFIERILKEFGFRVNINGDCIIARLEGHDQDFSIERLKVLGYLTVHTRQLDMIMANHARVNYYIDQMLNEIYSFVSV